MGMIAREAPPQLHTKDHAAMVEENSEPRNGSMSEAHRVALNEGKRRGQVVQTYLDALRERKPVPTGRSLKPDELRKRIEETQSELAEGELTTLNELKARANVVKWREQLAVHEQRQVDLPSLEAAFVEVAKEYGDAHKIPYAAWRDQGVPAAALRKAGIRP